jgi:hypothetical protein
MFRLIQGGKIMTPIPSPLRQKDPAIRWHNAGNIIAELLPPREWILGTTFCRGFLSGLLGAGGTGKSAIRCLQYLAVATGRPLTGEPVHFQGRVAMVCLEDQIGETQRRIAAAMVHHSIDPTEVDGQLLYCSPQGLKLMVDEGFGERGLGALYEQLGVPVDVIGLDPFVKAHTLDENNNGAMDDVVSLFIRLAGEWHFAPDIVHHTRKGGGAAGDADRGRGASAIVDAGRLMRTVTPMSEEEAEAFGVSSKERTRLVRVDDAKVNLVAHEDAAMWFRLVGVPLGNTGINPRYLNGDIVQTAERWYPPDMWQSVTSYIANLILDECESAQVAQVGFSDDPRAAPERAAWRVVQRHIPTFNDSQCQEVIKTWVKNGVLYHGKTRNANRVVVNGLFVNNLKRPGS